MTSTKLKYILLWRRPYDVDDPRRVLLLIQTLQNHVVTSLLFVLDKFVLIAISFYH